MEGMRMDTWEEFSAFGDIAELEHVCYLLEEAVKAVHIDAQHAVEMVGKNSQLTKRLKNQDDRSRAILERERPGLYQRTWMAHLFRDLYELLDELAKKPLRMPEELPRLLLDLHKVLIAAHDIFDPTHRASIVASAVVEAMQKGKAEAKSELGRKGGSASKRSEGVVAAIVNVLGSPNQKDTEAAVWAALKKFSSDSPLQISSKEGCSYRVYMDGRGEKATLYSLNQDGTQDGRSIKKSSFYRVFAAAKKSM